MVKPPAGAGLSKVTVKLPDAPSTGVIPAVTVTVGIVVTELVGAVAKLVTLSAVPC